MHPERTGEIDREREREGPGGQNNFALSANLSRSCARLSLSMHLPPLPLPPSCPFTSFHSFSIISALDPSLNKRPSAMLQDLDARFSLSRPFPPLFLHRLLSRILHFLPSSKSEVGVFLSPLISSFFGSRACYGWINVYITPDAAR